MTIKQCKSKKFITSNNMLKIWFSGTPLSKLHKFTGRQAAAVTTLAPSSHKDPDATGSVFTSLDMNSRTKFILSLHLLHGSKSVNQCATVHLMTSKTYLSSLYAQ